MVGLGEQLGEHLGGVHLGEQEEVHDHRVHFWAPLLLNQLWEDNIVASQVLPLIKYAFNANHPLALTVSFGGQGFLRPECTLGPNKLVFHVSFSDSKTLQTCFLKPPF